MGLGCACAPDHCDDSGGGIFLTGGAAAYISAHFRGGISGEGFSGLVSMMGSVSGQFE